MIVLCVYLCLHTHRWGVGRTGRCHWCSQCGRDITPTGMRTQMKIISLSSPWRRNLSSLLTMWTSSPAPAWETLSPAASMSKSKWTHTQCEQIHNTYPLFKRHFCYTCHTCSELLRKGWQSLNWRCYRRWDRHLFVLRKLNLSWIWC